MSHKLLFHKMFFVLFATVANVACFESVQAAEGSRLNWQTNYEEAVKASKNSSKPLLLFFTGSDWCGWCSKLEEEALHSPEFSEVAKDKFVFLKLDFPLYSPQDPQLKAQNKQLQQRFGVRSFPTLVIVDTQQNQQIGTTGYRPGGGKQYADYLLKMVRDYSSYKQKMSSMDQKKTPETELKQLYAKSKELGRAADSKEIIMRGMASSHPLFFSVEYYRLLGEQGHIHSQEAIALRDQLLSADPKNERSIHYQVALIEYETYCMQMDKDHTTYEAAVEPLIAYIQKFGNSDRENLWRLQMIISQVYLDGNQMTNALRHAEASYESAPAPAKQQIAQTIQSIRSQIHSFLFKKPSQLYTSCVC